MSDKVPRKFYEPFKASTRIHEVDKEIQIEATFQWYQPAHAHRVMFGLIQKKGFLDSDTDYLAIG